MTPQDRIRFACLALPETSERLSDGHPTFFVADQPFAQLRDDHRGDGRSVVCVRAEDSDEAQMPVDAAPGTSPRPAALGAVGSTGIDLATDPDWPLIEDRIARSWELAAPRRLLEAGGR